MLRIADIINALFELFGAHVAWANYFRLRNDREVKGVIPMLTTVYAAWGLWNCVFYATYGAWFSWTAGTVMTAANCAWVLLAFELQREAKRAQLVLARADHDTGPYILKTAPAAAHNHLGDTQEVDPDVVVREVAGLPQRAELIAKIDAMRDNYRRRQLPPVFVDEREPTAIWLNDADLIEEVQS